MVKSVSLDPRATTEEREADVCLLYKHYIQAQKHKQKEMVSMQKEFPAMFQLFLIPRHYQILCIFGVHTKLVFTHNRVQEKCAGKAMTTKMWRYNDKLWHSMTPYYHSFPFPSKNFQAYWEASFSFLYESLFKIWGPCSNYIASVNCAMDLQGWGEVARHSVI